MAPDDPKTIRVRCPHCDAKSAFATIPKSCAVVSEEQADGKVQSVCRECGAEFHIHFERL